MCTFACIIILSVINDMINADLRLIIQLAPCISHLITQLHTTCMLLLSMLLFRKWYHSCHSLARPVHTILDECNAFLASGSNPTA